ncbi:MAG: peptide chain release factor 2 [Chloroflexi bacterium]|nr:peptide chain release factor 2 [Chloroflexota bacterium]
MNKEQLHQLVEFREKVRELRGYLEISTKKNKLEELRDKTVQSDFWNNGDKAQSVLKKISLLEKSVKSVEIADRLNDDVQTLIELTGEAGGDELTAELKEVLGELEKSVDDMEFKRMLGEKEDSNDAILSINPGAGGTESQDWAAMLMRMYLRWCEQRNYRTETIELTPGDEAGIKSVTILVTGEYAFGYLQAEVGIHRLVRLSPFDAAHARHTSFALVEVLPEVESAAEVNLDPDDLRIDVFRASGKGGQNVQKNATAVRITHLPTGITVSCQNERSQHRNKESALKVLEARLLERELAQKAKDKEKLKGEHISAAWGNQIRSYVLHPYKMVKDHRTGYETSDAEGVLDGDIDELLSAYQKATLGD